MECNLKDIQKSELEILIYFDQLCRTNNLKYQLFAGTLLGAVRHKGFIPWDDDIDVCMPRQDYEKFKSIFCSKQFDERFFLQSNDTDKNSILQFSKIRKNGTVFEIESEEGLSNHNGVWIDIFPLDNVEINTKESKKQLSKLKHYYLLITSSVFPRVKHAKRLWKKIARFFLFLLTKIVGKKRIQTKINYWLNYFNNKNTTYINHLTNGVNDSRFHRYLMKSDSFENMIELEFEGNYFYAPKNYDDILRNCYGNYMELPPVEERVSCHRIINCKL